MPLIDTDTIDVTYVQQVVMEHIAACENQTQEEITPPWPVVLPTTGPLAPYDGCLTCQVRESIYATFVAAGIWEPM